jgi:RNA polymerase subunit RPABC4/transcription elongation factor Spt4
MITCSNCHQANRSNAFFCKFCGYVLACPRCRVVLEDPENYCDNCGQALAAGPSFTIAPLSQSRPWSGEIQRMEPAAGSPPLPTPLPAGQGSPVASGTPYLDQFVPQELMAKLELAQASSRMVGERRTAQRTPGDGQRLPSRRCELQT